MKPEEVHSDYKRIENDSLMHLLLGRYEVAEEGFLKLLSIVLKFQEREKTWIHKGSIYYHLGQVKLRQQDKFESSLDCLLLSYIEDTLSTVVDFEDGADRTPAASFLRDILLIDLRIFREIKILSRNYKENDEKVLNPKIILEKSLKALKITGNLEDIIKRKIAPTSIEPLGFPQPWENRVFVGTNYNTFYHVINEMKEAVISNDYTPIIASQVATPLDRIHHTSLLLHTCGHAIFDITQPAGQFMEIERLNDYEIPPLIVRSARYGDTSLPTWTSKMIETLGFNVIPYADMRDLKELINGYLQKDFPGENIEFHVEECKSLEQAKIEVKILPQNIINRGERLITEVHFEGNITDGFLDNAIKLSNGRVCWNWDMATLDNDDRKNKGKLNGNIIVDSKWAWDIPKSFPQIMCVISTRAYNHLEIGDRIRRPIVCNKETQIQIV